jgi:hypothetical protein
MKRQEAGTGGGKAARPVRERAASAPAGSKAQVSGGDPARPTRRQTRFGVTAQARGVVLVWRALLMKIDEVQARPLALLTAFGNNAEGRP